MRMRRGLRGAVLAAVTGMLAAAAVPLRADGERAATSAPDAWREVAVPEAFRTPSDGIDGVAWYLAPVRVPADWTATGVELFVEPFDAASEVFVDGTQVGATGAFPPFFRSGLGGSDRFAVPADVVRPGAVHLIAIRTCFRDGRTGFNVAAPVVFGSGGAIRLAGGWQLRPGDPPAGVAWARLDAANPAVGLEPFAAVEETAAVEATLKKIDDAGPLTAAEEQGRFVVADDLRVDLVLAEPEVRQPLSVRWDARGRLWTVQFIQYPDPAGLTMVSRDKFLRTVYDKVPAAPPAHDRGLDRITFHEDADGDGRFETHGTFVDGLSLVSSIAFDRDGLWVLVPPYLLFYPDADHDDRPDGDPVVHLEGFGIEDSHSIASNLRWGPDGWLYGSQGSTVSSRVRRPAGPDKPVVSVGQCIWRYHPPTGRYEIFAEGGGNAFGVEFDARGRLFSGHNGGDTRGFHYVQGGYYRKGFEKHGELSNPHAYGFFEPMKHHSAPRFTHALVIDEGGALGDRYAGTLFGVAPLQGQVVRAEIRADGSSVATKDLDVPLSCGDSWFRPVDLQLGPDGGLYICDFYEQRIDHASHYQGRIDRDRGRIWRLAAQDAPPGPLPALAGRDAAGLVDALVHPNRWVRQTALLELDWRRPAGARGLVAARLFGPRLEGTAAEHAVDLAWALVRLAAPTPAEWRSLLGHADPTVRAWAVRLVCDDGLADAALVDTLVDMGRREAEPFVRAQLAASLRRLDSAAALPVLMALLGGAAGAGDASDVHVPLLVWWATERLVGTDRDGLIARIVDGPLWTSGVGREVVAPRLVRRLASGSRDDLRAVATVLDSAPNDEARRSLLEAFERAFEGRSLAALPDEVVASIARAGGGSRTLRLRQGDAVAIAQTVARVIDPAVPVPERIRDVELLAETRPAAAEDTLLAVAAAPGDESLRRAALAALESWNDPRVAEAALELLPALPATLRGAACDLLASRADWAERLMAAVAAGRIDPQAIPDDTVRRMLLHARPSLTRSVEAAFGPVDGAATADMEAQVESLSGVLATGSGVPVRGRPLFLARCGGCHVLFGEGGRVGPDLTSHDRGDPRALLVHVVNPGAVIREGYETSVVTTADGRVLTGFVVEQDAGVVVLRTVDGRTVTIPRDEIDDVSRSPKSIMPEGLLTPLDAQEVRDLFAYLRATQPLAVR